MPAPKTRSAARPATRSAASGTHRVAPNTRSAAGTRPTAPRTRPEGCCPLQAVEPLSARRQAGIVRLFKALADPTRLEIVRLLRAQAGATCVCDIVDHFDLAQPTISHHLKVLREAGLIEQSRVGIWSFHRLDPEGAKLLDEAEALLAS